MPIHSVSASETLLNLPLDISLSETAQRLYDALRQAGEVVRDHRGYCNGVTVVTYFAPVEAVALAIGVTRQTVYNKLPELIERGLVDQRGHYCTHGGQTRSDGSLWAVRLNPDETSAPVRVEHDYLKGHYRDLGEDIRTGNTAWSLLQSKPEKAKQIELKYILAFAISPLRNSNTNDCKEAERPDLESLLDVQYVPVAARGEMVDKAAHAIGQALGTGAGSLNIWRWLVWSLLRLQEAQRKDHWYQCYLMVQRAASDRSEGACRNAGGLFVSRLKACGFWDEIQRAPRVRVGRAPIRA